MSTQKCLQICEQLSEHIDQIQLTSNRSASATGLIGPDEIPERLTNEGLQECRNSLVLTIARLENHMKDIMDRLVSKSKTVITSNDEAADLARLQEEWETTRQSLNICFKADNHLKDNASTIDNYATGDAVQFMVSTTGKIIHGKNRGMGWRTRQVGGYLSDASVQQLSRDMSRTSFHNTRNDSSPLRSHTSTAPQSAVDIDHMSEYKARYGQGFKLTSKFTPDTTTSPPDPDRSPVASAESGRNSLPKR